MSFYSLRAKNAQSQPQQSGGGMAEKYGTEKQPLASLYFFNFSFFSHTFQSVTFLYYLLFILYFFSQKKVRDVRLKQKTFCFV